MMPSKKNTVPEGWETFSKMGKRVPGTNFVPFKVPLKDVVNEKVYPPEERFSPMDIMENLPNLKMVIDLTFTDGDRYYDKRAFVKRGITVEKIRCAGGPNQLPRAYLVQRFFAIVDDFSGNPANKDALIGVHCTHGLNRTGYFICKYMTNRLAVSPRSAVEAFESARGHQMQRPRLVQDIMSSSTTSKPRSRRECGNSPLSGCYEDDVGSSNRRYRR